MKSSTSRILVTGGSGFIGTNLADALLERGAEFVNVDVTRPLDDRHAPFWRKVDIVDAGGLVQAFIDHRPTHVVHLAARTDTGKGPTLDDYRVNTDGTRHVLDSCASVGTVERVIVASTQFVCRPGCQAEHVRDYDPHTVYGESKVLAEEMTREWTAPIEWTIVRPTTLWGPWLLRHRTDFFRALRSGLYIHPAGRCIRSWGYVENVVQQTLALLDAESAQVSGGTFYLGDRPRDLSEIVDAFSFALTGHRVRRAPRWLIRSIALTGDAFTALGLRFPLTSSRYRSMTQEYPAPMESTFGVTGEPPVDLHTGVARTLDWLSRYESGMQ